MIKGYADPLNANRVALTADAICHMRVRRSGWSCSRLLYSEGYPSLCPGRLEKARVVEALQEAAFFIMDAPAPSPESRNFRQHMYEWD